MFFCGFRPSTRYGLVCRLGLLSGVMEKDRATKESADLGPESILKEGGCAV